eukprot:GHVU01056526.1.p2 GENE.GHVU01056526.1~~GHVU01056526.1.p2  ORF type:complete len:125 (+),score=15.35 GHVU01056526.1:329-703(+)
MERCQGIDLVEFVLGFKPGGIPERVCREVMKQVLLAVDHLHSKGVLHRDIKLDNIMFRDRNFTELALIDFDMCMLTDRTDPPRKMANPNEVSVVGTREYMVRVEKGKERSGIEIFKLICCRFVK